MNCLKKKLREIKMKIIKKEIENINCKIFEPSQKKERVLIAIHGFGGDCESSVIENVAKGLEGQGIVVFSFDLPCHGKDKITSELKLGSCLERIEKVLNIVKQKYKEEQISFFATSFGAYLLLNYIVKNKCNFEKIILRAPAIFMYEIFAKKILTEQGYSLTKINNHPIELGYERKMICEKSFVEELKINNLENFHFDKHIDIIQGDKDDIINIIDNEFYCKKHFEDYKIYYIQGADHRFKNDGDMDQIVFITKTIFENK